MELHEVVTFFWLWTDFFQGDVVSSVSFPKLSPPIVTEKGNIACLYIITHVQASHL